MSRDTTTSKITPINMKKFCAGPDDPRSYLLEPGLIKLKGIADPWVIATNGHYLVLIDGSDPDVFSVEEPLEFIKESICESVSKMLKASADCPPNLRRCTQLSDLNLPASVECSHCEGIGQVEDQCPCCMRTGRDDCGKCGGSGKGYQSVGIFGQCFNAEYLRLLSELPECKLCVLPQTDEKTITPSRLYFRGGSALLMPLKAPYDTHHDLLTAEPSGVNECAS